MKLYFNAKYRFNVPSPCNNYNQVLGLSRIILIRHQIFFTFLKYLDQVLLLAQDSQFLSEIVFFLCPLTPCISAPNLLQLLLVEPAGQRCSKYKWLFIDYLNTQNVDKADFYCSINCQLHIIWGQKDVYQHKINTSNEVVRNLDEFGNRNIVSSTDNKHCYSTQPMNEKYLQLSQAHLHKWSNSWTWCSLLLQTLFW